MYLLERFDEFMKSTTLGTLVEWICHLCQRCSLRRRILRLDHDNWQFIENILLWLWRRTSWHSGLLSTIKEHFKTESYQRKIINFDNTMRLDDNARLRQLSKRSSWSFLVGVTTFKINLETYEMVYFLFHPIWQCGLVLDTLLGSYLFIGFDELCGWSQALHAKFHNRSDGFFLPNPFKLLDF